jgi:hypothetical protein
LRNLAQIDPTTQRSILACKCGELLIVLGGEDEWRSEGPAVFECGACDSLITLPERKGRRRGRKGADYRSLSVEELLEELRTTKAS